MRMPIPKRIRFAVLERDGFACQYCGAKAPNVLLHVDHVIPVSLGGETHEDNLVTACEDCNVGKGSAPLSDSPEHVLAAADRGLDRAAVVRSLVEAAQQPTAVRGEPRDAPEKVVEAIETEAQAVAVSIAASKASQSFVANALGISEGYLSYIKNGKRPFPKKLVGPFCAATGTNLLRQFRDLQAALHECDERREVERLASMLEVA